MNRWVKYDSLTICCKCPLNQSSFGFLFHWHHTSFLYHMYELANKLQFTLDLIDLNFFSLFSLTQLIVYRVFIHKISLLPVCWSSIFLNEWESKLFVAALPLCLPLGPPYATHYKLFANRGGLKCRGTFDDGMQACALLLSAANPVLSCLLSCLLARLENF